MVLPIRCFTCGKVLRHNEQYIQKLQDVRDGSVTTDIYRYIDSFFHEFGYTRECCWRMYKSQVDLDQYLLLYPTINTSPEKIEISKKLKKRKTK